MATVDSKKNNKLLSGQRDVTVDLVKTIAIIGVLVIHLYTGVNVNPVKSFDWLAGNFYGCLMRASVPLFLMCSGVLFLSIKKELSLKRFFTKNYLRIVISLFVWALAYKVVYMAIDGNFSLENLWLKFKEVILFNHEVRLYYLHITLLVYAVLPVLKVFSDNATKRQLQYAIVLWFVLGILYPALCTMKPFALMTGIPVQWKLNLTYSCIGYCLLGHYLKKYPISLRQSIASTVFGFAYTYGGTVWLSIKQESLNSTLLDGNSVGVCFLAIGVFGLCCNLSHRIGEELASFLAYVSKASFCIYLSHLFVIYCLFKINVNVHILPAMISIPVIVALAFAFSILIYTVLSRIPLVKKWLI